MGFIDLPDIHLQRRGPDDYQLLTRLTYEDRTYGRIVAPKDTSDFRTDLASVPIFAAWLVPTTGRHLPATMLHDILILNENEQQQHEGRAVPGIEADRIYREAMGELGVPVVRRWMIWAAVSLRSLWAETDSRGGPRWLWRARIGVMIALILAFGTVVTLDLLDEWSPFPWSDEAWYIEMLAVFVGWTILTAVAAIVLIPYWQVGAVAAAALLVLGPGLVIAAFFYGVYLVIELAVSCREGRGPLINSNPSTADRESLSPPAGHDRRGPELGRSAV